MTLRCDVAIVGAGPYGLSVAAHLLPMNIEARVFGEPMDFWRRQMPMGMLLRSEKHASNISAPDRNLGLEDYLAGAGINVSTQVRVEDFIEYGCWFQKQAISDLDTRRVMKVDRHKSGFLLRLEDDEQILAQRVVVAAGIAAFAHRPRQFLSLPAEQASHSVDHRDLAKFAGARVVVIGAGQSAFESAALLIENGADVEIIVRAPNVFWIPGRKSSKPIAGIQARLFPPHGIGSRKFSYLVARPHLFRQLPRVLQDVITYSGVRPKVSTWVKPRLGSASITTSCSVLSALPTIGGPLLTLVDGSERRVDHVLLATGYRVDISRYQFLPPELLQSIDCVNGYPALNPDFESSIPGLYFVGASAGQSFGPLVRFVVGADYSAKAVARSIKSRFGSRPRRQRPQLSINSNISHLPKKRSATVGALVLGGDFGALGVVRSLGRHNIPVWTILEPHELAGKSCYSARSLRWPDLGENRQVEFLLELGRRFALEGWVLFPIGDERAALLARNRDLLERQFHVTTPDWQVMRWAYDKRLTYQLASSLGLNCPQTLYPQTRDEVLDLDCTFPVIIKPAIKKTLNRLTFEKAWLARDRTELLKLYDQAVGLVDPSVVMLQEMIPGGGDTQFSYGALYSEGSPIASLVARRTRQFPVVFGRTSSFVETIERPEVETAASTLLKAMNYSGIVEVEFKYDFRDRSYKVLDINPRTWAWQALGGRAGVEFPYLAWRWAQGHQLTRTFGRPGIKWLHGRMDVRAAASEMWHGRLSPARYLQSILSARVCAILAADDLVPALLATPLTLASRLSRSRLFRKSRIGNVEYQPGDDSQAAVPKSTASIKRVTFVQKTLSREP